jgi:LacI family repressor for deo operon, udp, cdd, tsx, nupC, and nupG
MRASRFPNITSKSVISATNRGFMLIVLKEPPTALFVANSEMTLGALTALRERHVNVPRDLSIVGFDDPLWARHLDPALTVVTQPIVEMAKMATGLLLSLLQDSEVIRSEILPQNAS